MRCGSFRADHRDHAGADVGVFAGGVFTGDHRANVSAICAVIAATAIISATNAVTLKPTQCATWLRQPDPNAKKNFFYRGFNAGYARLEAWYLRVVRRMVSRSGFMAVIVLVLIALAGGVSLACRPVSFQPKTRATCSSRSNCLTPLPSRARSARWRKCATSFCKRPESRTPSRSAEFRRSITTPRLQTPGAIYVMFKDWSERGKDENILDIYNSLSRNLSQFQEAACRVIVPPPIQGLGLSGGFQMEVELTDGSFDYERLQKVTEQLAARSTSSPVIDAAITTFRADVPQLNLDVNRTEAATFNVADRRHLRHAAKLSWLHLCEPVHEIRPHLHRLRAGR